MSEVEELFAVVDALEKIAAVSDEPEVRKSIQAIGDACNAVHEVFSGSWIGYHARTYQEGFEAEPGARFDSEWGVRGSGLSGTTGRWVQYCRDAVRRYIFGQAGYDSLGELPDRASIIERDFERLKSQAISILSSALSERDDTYLAKLKTDLEKVKVFSAHEAAQAWQPSGQYMTRDSEAAAGGVLTPAHIALLGEITAIATVFRAGREAAEIVRQAASHMERNARKTRRVDRVGTNIFLGHGRSPQWRELKDFIQDRLHLPADEFNRVPVAGVTNIARLAEMLDAAAFAFIIMTAEDETAEGTMQARMNVIHEVGLFQGRLGFTRGIVMLEEGCEEFSNIQGLGQIRYPKGRISAAFEDVRQVLEREGLIS